MTPVALTQNTASRLKRLLGDQDGGEGGPAAGVGGQGSALVRCTSTTAAGGAGAAAQCYPGVLVDPAADLTAQGELGTVWLTLLGDAAAVRVPTLNRIYAVLVAGYLTISGDTRPRVFGVPVGWFSGARVQNAANQGIPNNTTTVLTFDSERFDTDGYHDNATNPDRLTVPAAGYYSVGVIWWNPYVNAGYRSLSISVNGGSIVANFGISPAAAAGTESSIITSAIWQAAAGDYFTAAALQKTGGTITGTQPNEFWIHRLG
jgi:hypothetical protein